MSEDLVFWRAYRKKYSLSLHSVEMDTGVKRNLKGRSHEMDLAFEDIGLKEDAASF
jgi:hypothetical protein